MKKIYLGTIAMAMVALLGMGIISAGGFGFGGDLTDEEKQEMQEHKEAMKIAIESGNYADWEALMQERLAVMEDKITEEDFQKIQERHAERSDFREAVEELKASGDFSREDMQELREEYGIEGKGPAMKKGRGSRQGNCPLTD